eukprot:UN01907
MVLIPLLVCIVDLSPPFLCRYLYFSLFLFFFFISHHISKGSCFFSI